MTSAMAKIARIERQIENLVRLHDVIGNTIDDLVTDLSSLKAELGLSGGQPELISESPVPVAAARGPSSPAVSPSSGGC